MSMSREGARSWEVSLNKLRIKTRITCFYCRMKPVRCSEEEVFLFEVFIPNMNECLFEI